MNTTSIGLRSDTPHSSLNQMPDDGRLEDPTPLSAHSTPNEKEIDNNDTKTTMTPRQQPKRQKIFL